MKYTLIAGLGLALAASAAVAEEAKPETKVERHHVVMLGGDHAKMDANGDGEVTRDEFAAMHAEMFAKLDADKNGKLTKEERHAGHMKMMRHGGEHGPHAMGPHHGPGDARVHVFEMRGDGPGEMDADKDGKISPDEFAAPMKRAFEQLDADKSGFLEEGERAKGPMRFERKIETK